MNGLGTPTPGSWGVDQPLVTATPCTRNTSWALPCHLSLMNCKSRAEAFARSLHCKLRSLSRLSSGGNYDDDDDNGQIGESDAVNHAAAVDTTHDDGMDQLVKTAALNCGCEFGQFTNYCNERTHLMTTFKSKDVNGVNAETTANVSNPLTANDEDELLFDLGFYSPESSNEQPAVLSPDENCCDISNADGISIPLLHIENHQYFNNDDVEESGCISSVSSALTEQDNDDDDDDEFDFDYFKFQISEQPPALTSSPVPITSQPRRCLANDILSDYPLSEIDILVPNCDSGSFHSPNNLSPTINGKQTSPPPQPQPWEAKEGGFLPITDIQQADLEQGRGAINFENSSKVVDIEEVCEEACAEVETTVAVTLNRIINELSDMGINESEQLSGPASVIESNEAISSTNDDGVGVIETVDNLDQNQTAIMVESRTELVDCHVAPVQQNNNWIVQDENNLVPHSDVISTTPDRPNIKLSLPEFFHEQSANNEGKGTALTPEALEDDVPVRVRRSSSLKTCKTPPGTPNRKKIVRFADAMGLDLEDVKTVFLDDLPVVPSSAFKDLESSAYEDDDDQVATNNDFDSSTACEINNPFTFTRPKTNLVPVFPQPGSLPDFFDRLRKQSVCLESAVVTGCSTVRLVIRVLNLDFRKVVTVRYTTCEWKGCNDVLAEYVDKSNDVFSDKFHTVITSDHLQVGERLCFAISYKAEGKEFWDNNGGQNYVFQCFPEHDRHPSPPDESWIHFL